MYIYIHTIYIYIHSMYVCVCMYICIYIGYRYNLYISIGYQSLLRLTTIHWGSLGPVLLTHHCLHLLKSVLEPLALGSI